MPFTARIFAHRALLVCCFALPALSFAQSTATTTATQQTNVTPPVQPVTTTVIVHGKANDDYLPDTVTVGTLDGAPLNETPLSATVVTHDLLLDQGARLLSDIVKNDASIGEDYAPVGYYGDYEIRGFAIDLATALQINGMTIAGEQDVPLENKERVELLKGIAGLESGVASAGGLINYVTKQPAAVKALELATDHRGSAYGAVDLGALFGAQKQFGLRSNLGGERIATYVNGANGWRTVGTASADWKMSPKAILKGDFEFQHKVERSVCGYQLLGGTTVPDITQISPSTMLGEQTWEKPNTFDTLNSGARLDYDISTVWHAFAAASFSRSLIDDNVVYAYGCYYQALCDANGGPAPSYFFAPDGGYDIYDYRDPGELRIDAQAEALLTGHIKTGPFSQDLAAGVELFRRGVQQPGYYTADNPYDPNGVFQDGAVYTYVGSDNIYQPIAPVDLSAAEDPHQSAGPLRLWQDDHQSAAIIQDRVHIPGHIQLVAAGRYDWLRDHNYSLAATDPSQAPILTDKPVWLPQYAVLFNPATSLTLYANYGVLLSLGPQGPFWTDNGSQFLSSFLTRQSEIGAKFLPNQRLLISTALFHMRAPFFYPRVIQQPDRFCQLNSATGATVQPGDLCFEQQGHETHDGVELNAEGKAASWLRLTASAAAIRAVSTDTLTPAFDTKQVLNVPHLRATAFADVALPHLPGLHLMPGWSFTGRKEATRDDTVSVPGYNLFNLGARYTPGGEQGRITFRIYADNITDKRYWKDTGASYGDTFIHLGAPTTVRLSAHYTF